MRVLLGLALAMGLALTQAQTAPRVELSGPRNVIFFHPDGYGFSHWSALRTYLVGPDGRLNWDRLPYIAPYTGHMRDTLAATSHGGATVHAYGVKVASDSFGMDEHQVLTARSGRQMSIMEEAIEAGFATALLQSAGITEAGTAAFVASVEERGMHEEIAKQVIKSGLDVILGGGEVWLLPEGVQGRHGIGQRADGLNLIEQAKELGYVVVYTREELMEAAADPAIARVLGVFAHDSTFNGAPEEALRAQGLPLYWPWAPTIGEMAEAALAILSRNPNAAKRGIFIIAEEEGTDNFGNNSNARGSFEAGRRADAALGVFAGFVRQNPYTLLITAADSGAGAKSIMGLDLLSPEELDGLMHRMAAGWVPSYRVNTGPDGEWVEAPFDGADGAATEPFLAAPDREGNRFLFGVAWVRGDVSGHVVARAKGHNAEVVRELGIVDSSDIYRIMYYTLFDRWLGAPVE